MWKIDTDGGTNASSCAQRGQWKGPGVVAHYGSNVSAMNGHSRVSPRWRAQLKLVAFAIKVCADFLQKNDVPHRHVCGTLDQRRFAFDVPCHHSHILQG